MKDERDYAISLTRVVGMFLIILCHIFTFYSINALAQLFNVGIYVFFLISGYLYSGKNIDRKPSWLYSRWIKLCIPIYIWVLFISSLMVTKGKTLSIIELILFAFNLQGLSWVIPEFPSISIDGPFSGLGNLWFVTVIMLCYILMQILKRRSNTLNTTKKKGGERYSFILVLFVVALFIAPIKINLFYFVCFFAGYYCLPILLTKIGCCTKAVCVLITMAISVALRLISKRLFDDTWLYNIVIVNFTHIVLAIGIVILITFFTKKMKSVSKFASSSFIFRVDTLSYFVYITHNFFLSRNFCLSENFRNPLSQMVVFFAMTLISSLLLFYVSKFIKNRIPCIGKA